MRRMVCQDILGLFYGFLLFFAKMQKTHTRARAGSQKNPVGVWCGVIWAGWDGTSVVGMWMDDAKG